MGWKEKKKAMGEFTLKGNVDALHMVLGKDHKGWVVGKGGVCVRLKKAFGKGVLLLNQARWHLKK